MKKKGLLFSFFMGITFFIGLVLGKPYFDAYKERQQYEFTLNTIDGPIKLSDFKGKNVAIYFGFMHCPDVCPTSLSILSESLKGYSKEQLKNFVGLFISVDPKRDKLKDLKSYAAYFHPNFIGATSDEKTLKEIAKRYGTYFAYEKPIDGNPMHYLVAHTSYLYIFDKQGNLSSKLKHDALVPKEITKALKKVL